MDDRWKPSPGQVTLLQAGVDGEDRVTGVVVGGDEQRLVIDVGAGRVPAAGAEVLASFFAPKALYRVSGFAAPLEDHQTRIELSVRSVERVQRRATPRARVTLPAVLSDFDSEAEPISVVGETVDVGPGGCRVRTGRAFPPSSDPTISLELPDGHTVSALGAILQVEGSEGAWEYRLVFMSIDDADAAHLTALANEAGAGG